MLTLEGVLKQVDARIEELQRAKALLSYEGEPTHKLTLVSPKWTDKKTSFGVEHVLATAPKRKMSKKGREAIAEAQRKRWAKKKRIQRAMQKIKAHATRQLKVVNG